MFRSLSLCALVAALSAGGCAGRIAGPFPQRAPNAAEYRIGTGDVLRVAVWQNQELSSRVTVRPDGFVTLPLVGEMQVAGRSVAEANRLVGDSYRRFIAAEHHVSVIVEEIHSYRVYVLGRVAHPGEFEARRPVTVLQALALAGGPLRTADTGAIAVITRDASSQQRRRYLVSYDEATAGRLEMDFELASGDTIVVP